MAFRKNFFTILLGGILLLPAGPASAQFLTIARKIKSMKSGDKDVATVILDAGASGVFRALTDTLSADPKTKILGSDILKMKIDFTHTACSMTIQVDSLDTNLSQITVLAQKKEDSEQQVSDMAARAILAVCAKAGVNCTLK